MSLQRILAAKAFVSMSMEKDAFDKDVMEVQRDLKKTGKRAREAARDFGAIGDTLDILGAEGAANVFQGFEELERNSEKIVKAQQAIVKHSQSWKDEIAGISTAFKAIAGLHPGIKAGIVAIGAVAAGMAIAFAKVTEQLQKQKRLQKELKEIQEKRFSNLVDEIGKLERPDREGSAAEALIGKRADLDAAIKRVEHLRDILSGTNLPSARAPLFEAVKNVKQLRKEVAQLEALLGGPRPFANADMSGLARAGDARALLASRQGLANLGIGDAIQKESKRLAEEFKSIGDSIKKSRFNEWFEKAAKNAREAAEAQERLNAARDSWARWRVRSRVDAAMAGGLGGTASQLGSFAAGRGGYAGGVMRQTENREKRRARVQGKIIAEEIVKGLKDTQEGTERVLKGIQQTWEGIVGSG